MRNRAIVLILGSLATAAPPAHAQGGLLGKVVRGAQRVAAHVDSACARDVACSGRTARQGGHADTTVGGALAIVRAGVVEGTDMATALFDTTDRLGIIREQRPCSPTRPCVAGWDLRVLSVAPPRDTVPALVSFPVTVVIENRGRSGSPATELMVCPAAIYGGDDFDCERRQPPIEIPALAGGERATITVAQRFLENESSWRFAAAVDPDHATGERSISNNWVVGEVTEAVLPTLQWMQFEVHEDEVMKGGYLTVSMLIRNASFTARSEPTEVGVGDLWTHEDATNRLPLPALGPRQSYRVQVRIPAATGVHAGIDTDRRRKWGHGHEASPRSVDVTVHDR